MHRSAPTAPASSAVQAGIFTMVPLVIALAPFALVLGSLAAQSRDPIAGWSGSWLIYGGSAHIAALQVDQTGVALAILTGVLVHTRLLVYSSSLAGRWHAQPRWFRVLGAAMIIDPTWAAAEQHAATGATDEEQRRFFLAAGLTIGIGWSATIALGALVADQLPTAGLELAVALCMIALLGSRLHTRAHRAAAVTAAAFAIVLRDLPAGSGALVAIAAGTLVARRLEGADA